MLTRRQQYERQIKKIELLEGSFLRRGRGLQRKRLKSLLLFLRQGFEGGIPQVVKLLSMPGLQGNMQVFVDEFVLLMWIEGAISGRRELRDSDSKPQGLGFDAHGPNLALLAFSPLAAIDWIKSRKEFNRFFDGDLAEKARSAITEILEKGLGIVASVKLLRKVFGEFSGPRLENIAQTESISAFNNGRIAMFKADPGFVVAVRFLAIKDRRTTDICKDRDELILPLNHPLVAQNTPVLHYRCRSLWSPITKFEARRRMKAGGFLTIQEWLAHEVSKWAGITPVMEGFSSGPSPAPATSRTLVP